MAEGILTTFGRHCCQLALLLSVATGLWTGNAGAEQAVGASIIALIADPERYDGKFVRIIGFLRVEFEGTAVYLHQSDYENGITKNGLWAQVDIGQKELDKRYVLLEGTFRADVHGHMGLWSGAITDIRRAQAWSDPEEPRRRDSSLGRF